MSEELSKEAREKLDHFNKEATDWRAVCRVCGATLVGTLAHLLKHKDECPGGRELTTSSPISSPDAA